MDIVVIEDNDGLRRAIARTLSDGGYRVSAFTCAEEFIEDPRSNDPNLLLIDVNLPGESGLSLTARMRRLQPRIGIIILTARTRPADRRDGYDMGADIYLTKPVEPDELNAAVRALLRRVAQPQEPVLEFRIDLKARRLHGPAGKVALSGAETAVLVALARAPDRRLEAWQIAEVLGGDGAVASRNTVNVTIFRINQKIIETGADERCIRAIRNWGYSLSLDIGIEG
jgi:DNA-binding response OmpR family regulator